MRIITLPYPQLSRLVCYIIVCNLLLGYISFGICPSAIFLFVKKVYLSILTAQSKGIMQRNKKEIFSYIHNLKVWFYFEFCYASILCPLIFWIYMKENRDKNRNRRSNIWTFRRSGTYINDVQFFGSFLTHLSLIVWVLPYDVRFWGVILTPPPL